MSDYIRNDALYGSGSQGPGPQPDNAYDRMRSVPACHLVKTPNAVAVTADIGATVGFFFGGAAKFEEKTTSEGPSSLSTKVLSGSANYQDYGAMATGVYNIHPSAVTGSAADIAKIQFIYKSGLSTGPV